MSEDTQADTAPVVLPDPPPPTPEEIKAAQDADAAADAAKKPIDQLQVHLQQLRNFKAFTAAKAESVVKKIEDAGGEVGASLKEVLATIEAEAK